VNLTERATAELARRTSRRSLVGGRRSLVGAMTAAHDDSTALVERLSEHLGSGLPARVNGLALVALAALALAAA
jgi:hypothetical protein